MKQRTNQGVESHSWGRVEPMEKKKQTGNGEIGGRMNQHPKGLGKAYFGSQGGTRRTLHKFAADRTGCVYEKTSKIRKTQERIKGGRQKWGIVGGGGTRLRNHKNRQNTRGSREDRVRRKMNRRKVHETRKMGSNEKCPAYGNRPRPMNTHNPYNTRAVFQAKRPSPFQMT